MTGPGLEGEVLADRYRVTESLGSGGMATVYLAHDERSFGRQVVIKAPHQSMLDLPGWRERFQHEMKRLVELEHPHIVNIIDVGEAKELPYAVLQYLAGGSLLDRVIEAGGRLTGREVLRWLPTVAGALDFIHRRGVVHRDVKPGNILFDEESHVFIADFGIAKVLSGQDLTELTLTGVISGSPSYMAPEEAMGRKVDGAYDQYALAVVLYEVLSGHFPHEGAPTPVALLAQKIGEDPEPLGRYLPELPEASTKAIMTALSRDPWNRYPSCSEFAQAFAKGLTADVKQTVPFEAPTVPPMTRPPSPQLTSEKRRTARRHTRRLAAIVASVVAAVLVGLIAWLQPWGVPVETTEPPPPRQESAITATPVPPAPATPVPPAPATPPEESAAVPQVQEAVPTPPAKPKVTPPPPAKVAPPAQPEPVPSRMPEIPASPRPKASDQQVKPDKKTREPLQLRPPRPVTPEDWRTYQRQMRKAYARAFRIDGSAEHTAVQKAEIWRRYLRTFTYDNPSTDEDNQLRDYAQARVGFWNK